MLPTIVKLLVRSLPSKKLAALLCDLGSACEVKRLPPYNQILILLLDSMASSMVWRGFA